jgi:CHAP domain
MNKQYLSGFTKAPVLVFALLIALALPFISLPEATATPTCPQDGTRCDAWGTLEKTAASWLTSNGNGVDVYSNGSTAEGPSPDVYNCYPIADGVDQLGCGTTTTPSGIKWQCVELFNRLYMTKGWISSRWAGNGNSLYTIGTLPTGFTKEDNTHTTFINPGDAITFDDGSFGHVAMVDTVTGTGATKTVNMVSQNTKQTTFTVSWNTTTHTLTQTYLTGYGVQGTIHRPAVTPPPSYAWLQLAGDWTGKGYDSIGLFNPNTMIYYLRNSNTSGIADITGQFGNAGWLPIVGDWDGNGTDTIGVYDPVTATFYLSNSNTSPTATYTPQFGNGGTWIPIVGDWDGNGTTTVGVYNPSTATFYLSNSNTSPTATYTTVLGNANWIPVVGDWDGNGTTTIGVDNKGSTFYLSNSNSSGIADVAAFAFGNSVWLPVMGDWGGDHTTTVGVYNHINTTFYLRDSNTSGDADMTLPYGNPN